MQESWSYGYDSIYRLTQAAPTGGIHQSESYTYDQVGKRLTKTNELPPQDNETTNYTYDDENRLTKVVITRNAKQKELTFTYDPFGRRITKTLTKDEIGTDCTAPNVCPRTTTYVYDNQSIIAEYDTNGEVLNRYTHGPNIDEPLAIEVKTGATYTPYYYHADGLGSITSISNAGGTVVQRYAYDSFGNMTITTNGNISQPYTFTSREYDTETGMYFYRARYYDPKAGRFVTKDPIGFEGGDVNLFVYVFNSPQNYRDPKGEWIVPAIKTGIVLYALYQAYKEWKKFDETNKKLQENAAACSKARDNNADIQACYDLIDDYQNTIRAGIKAGSKTPGTSCKGRL